MESGGNLHEESLDRPEAWSCQKSVPSYWSPENWSLIYLALQRIFRKVKEPFWTSYLNLVNTRHRARIFRTVRRDQGVQRLPKNRRACAFLARRTVSRYACFHGEHMELGRHPPGTMLPAFCREWYYFLQIHFSITCHQRNYISGYIFGIFPSGILNCLAN